MAGVFSAWVPSKGGVYAFWLFVGDQTFGFNLNLPELIAEDLPRFFLAVGGEPFPLFPLRYESDVQFARRPPLAGELVLP